MKSFKYLVSDIITGRDFFCINNIKAVVNFLKTLDNNQDIQNVQSLGLKEVFNAIRLHVLTSRRNKNIETTEDLVQTFYLYLDIHFPEFQWKT